MNYLVTGNAGFIGSAIATKLLKLGNVVYGIDNLSTGSKDNIDNKIKFIDGDLANEETIKKLNNINLDGIFHIGGQSSGEISFENPEYDLFSNALSTLKLLKFCVKSKCKKIVFASSMSVYGDIDYKEKYNELDKTNPKSFYAIHKLISEKYMEIFFKQFGVCYVALRYFNVYGPGQNLKNMKQGMISIYLKQFLDVNFDEVIIKGNTKRFRDFIYIDDVVDITIEAMKNINFNNKIINVGTGKKKQVSEVLKIIQKYTCSKKNVKVVEGTPGDQFGIYADNQKLLSILDYSFVDLDIGLNKTIDWIKKNENAM